MENWIGLHEEKLGMEHPCGSVAGLRQRHTEACARWADRCRWAWGPCCPLKTSTDWVQWPLLFVSTAPVGLPRRGFCMHDFTECS